MNALSAHAILQLWENGLARHPVERALLILATALPAMPADELPLLSIGQRDRYLLAVREATFGRQLAASITCPACQGQLEFTCTTGDIRVPAAEEPEGQWYQEVIEGYTLTFRVPNSDDLALIVDARDPGRARQLLLARCIQQASREDVAIGITDLPATVLSALVERMAEHDPQAEILLNLTCPGCDQHWSELFDIAAFILVEIEVCARRLLYAIHTLASAYGWREADILALSAGRRAFYLEIVTR